MNHRTVCTIALVALLIVVGLGAGAPQQPLAGNAPHAGQSDARVSGLPACPITGPGGSQYTLSGEESVAPLCGRA
jgi:hypothetical protein